MSRPRGNSRDRKAEKVGEATETAGGRREVFLVTTGGGRVTGVYGSLDRAVLSADGSDKKVTKYRMNEESQIVGEARLPMSIGWKLAIFLVPIILAYTVLVERDGQRLVIKMLNVTTDNIPWIPTPTEGVGSRLRKVENLRAESPVVMIPGIVSSGLEVWSGEECASANFRQRFWGQVSMLKKLATDRKCWINHMKLDPKTWDDPKNIKLRAASGLGAADYFIQGYYVWGKVIQELAAVGYEENLNMYMASYDWRLPCAIMERRDRFMTRLRAQIELMYKMNGKKRIAVLTHSMGTSVWLYFQSWVTSSHPDGGNGGSDWVDRHIESFVNIGGALLGAPKTLPAVLSGEMRDTAEMGQVGKFIQRQFFSDEDILSFFRSLGSLPMLFPKDWDDAIFNFNKSRPYNANEAFEKLLPKHAPKYMDLVQKYYELNTTSKNVSDAPSHPSWWPSSLLSPLAYGPTTKVFCLYGTGKPTEVSYHYHAPPLLKVDLNYNVNGYKNGVLSSDGDGTVPLRSLGLLCASPRGWNGTSALNPSGSPVVVREYEHKPFPLAAQGGRNSADHVDIMGNHLLLEDLLRIVTKSSISKVSSRYFSEIPVAAEGWRLNCET